MSTSSDTTSYERVCALSDLPAMGAARAQVGGAMIALVRDEEGGVHAVQDECTHGSVSLSEGEVEGCTIECWLHGSRFDLRSGAPLTPPATSPLRVYPVKIDDGDVYVAPSAEQES